MAEDCPHCDRTLPNRSALEDHVERAHADEAAAGTNWTPIVVGAIVVVALGALGAALITGGGGAGGGFHVEDSPHTGDADAPVKFVAFESPACTSCRLFHVPRDGQASTFQRILDTYGSNEDFVYVEKYSPAGYGWDRVGANAQRCAWHMGGWESFHALTQAYYEERSRISGSNAAGFALNWADTHQDVDRDAFAACFEENRYDGELSTDVADGRSAGVSGTPTFVIVGPDGETTTIVGPQPYTSFQTVIEHELDKVAGEPGEGSGNASNDSSDGDASGGNASVHAARDAREADA